MDEFKIKNFEFLVCLTFVNRIEELEVYKFIEKLLYGDMTKSELDLYKEMINTKNITEFMLYIKQNHSLKPCQKDVKIKRKNVTESMLENYVIKNQLSQQYLKELKFKILLKIIPNKNIIVKNGDIIEIINV